MDGLDIDDEQEELSLERAQQIIQQQAERIRHLENIEERFKRLQNEYDRLKSEKSFPKPNQENQSVDTTAQELRKAKDALNEKERRLQFLEEANNRLIFRMRNLQVEIGSKDQEIKELNQEINYVKRKLDKPTEICIVINEIKQKDTLIAKFRKSQRQSGTASIKVNEIRPEDFSYKYGHLPSSYADSSYSDAPSYYGGHHRIIRQNRVSVQDETDIINEWNKTLQIFSDSEDPKMILRLKQYVVLSIYRLSTLGKDSQIEEEGIYSNNCYLCQQPFNCTHKAKICSLCGYMFCKKCSPRCLPLGENHEKRRVCVLCESMYRFVYRKEDAS